MKKVVFFDGDGTLWYPKTTKRTVAPHWVYHDPAITDPWSLFIPVPTVVETLQRLGEMKIKRVLLSTSPLPEEEAIMSRIKAAKQIDIYHLLDDVQVAPDYMEGKGERITALLEKYGLTPENALMVGDTFNWDYKSAQDVGVEGLLIRSDYQQEFIPELPDDRLITDLEELLAKI
jgi:FMN phosphatase YigB (HAD superfamily)